MQGNQAQSYDVDIVLCIDATGSMLPVIDDVKKNALTFHDALIKNMEDKSKICDNLRIKVITFRDYYDRADDALEESSFFQLPEQKESFDNFINSIVADGGGDEPESGLEALCLAINSDWKQDANKRRELIVIWTDASAHPLDSNKVKPGNYPSGIPKDFAELTDLWFDVQDLQQSRPNSARRLLMYAPDASPWTDIVTHWTQSIHIPTNAGKGMEDFEFQEILDAIANSV